MADFNSATMLDVSKDLVTQFTATRSGTDLIVSAISSGAIYPGMVVTGSGITSFVVQEKLATTGTELERWKTYNLTADFDAAISGTTLTVTNVRSGTVSGRISLTIESEFWWSITSQTSGATGGAGTYTLNPGIGVGGLRATTARWFSYVLSGATVSTDTLMTGRLYGASTSAATTGENVKLARFACAARSSDKALYLPAGTFVGWSGMAYPLAGPYSYKSIAFFGAGSSGASRTVLRGDLAGNLGYSLNGVSYTDIRFEAIKPGGTKKISGCHFWYPDKTAAFTGSISGTTLTVTELTRGFIQVGATVAGTGVTSCTVSAFVSGTPGGIGVYTVSVSQTVSQRSLSSNRVDTYFSADSLALNADYEITNNTFDLPGTYIPLWINNPRNAVVRGNTFLYRDEGFNTHTIRVDSGDGSAKSVEITYNKLYMTSTTSIFAGSNRLAPIRNLIMDWNEVHRNTEEAIAIDGFGNDIGLCPCICNGRLTTLSNDAAGRLVVSLDQFIYNPGAGAVRCPVSARDLDLSGYVTDDVFTTTASHSGYSAPGSTLKGAGVPADTVITGVISRPSVGGAGTTFRLNKSFTLGSAGAPVTVKMADWKKFYFIFSEGTGADGTIIEIYDYDATANTVTLDMMRSASLFSTGTNTWAGVHAGFFGGSCSHNRVSGDSRSGQNSSATYSTGISLYHNVFNFDVGHNEVSGINAGIHVVGGYMLSTYHVLAYHNSIHDNVTANTQTNGDAVSIVTQYFGIPQRGNRLVNNTGIRASVVLDGVADTVCENNILVGDNAKVVRRLNPPVLPATDI